MDPQQIVLYEASEQRLGSVTALLLTRWNSGELPSELGEHKEIPVTKVPTTVLHGHQFIEVNILADIMVTRRLFFGQLPLEQVTGFRDEYTGRILTPGFTTGWLDAAEVERNWRQIQSVDEIAVRPILELVALDIADIPQMA